MRATPQTLGAFVAVVGPSGAGKDSIIEGARARLVGGNARSGNGYSFPRRVITRPDGPGEDHVSVAPSEFNHAAQRGEFALTWQAHDLNYGIPVTTLDDIARGTLVVANVSRTTLPQLASIFGCSYAVHVTVSDRVRRQRVQERGRENPLQVQTRMERADPAPDFPYDLCIHNDTQLDDSISELVTFLHNVPVTPSV